MGTLLFIVSVAFLFLVVVGFHEFGHFGVAKLLGIGVDEFALGFGPKVVSRKFGETLYSLRLLPMGGFARLRGYATNDHLTNGERDCLSSFRHSCYNLDTSPMVI